jgi:protein-tyrosine-phosphatase
MASAQTVLFLCTGNSARSIMAECSLNRRGAGRFRAYSAGSHPAGRVHPLALTLLAELGYSTQALRSKGWDEFARPDSPRLDFVFTVCDKAAGEACPIWPGRPVTAHWGVEDPAGFAGPEDEHLRLFYRVYRELDNRIETFTSLPLDALNGPALQQQLDAIGRATLEGEPAS